MPDIKIKTSTGWVALGGGGGPTGGAGAPALTTVVGVPDNATGADNDWALSSDGHIYRRIAGAWAPQFEIPLPPDTPLGVLVFNDVADGAVALTVTWLPAPRAAYYKVTVRGSSGAGTPRTSQVTGTRALVTGGEPMGEGVTVAVVACNAGGTSEPSALVDGYTAQTAAALVSVTPASGGLVGGADVAIVGSYYSALQDATGILFGATAATGVTFDERDGTLHATAPAHAGGSVTVTVQRPSGDLVLPSGFLYGAAGAPQNVVVTAGAAQMSVAFAPPLDDGGSPVTGYLVTVNYMGSVYPYAPPKRVTASPAVFRALQFGVELDVTVQATNGFGDGATSASVAVNDITEGHSFVAFQNAQYAAPGIAGGYVFTLGAAAGVVETPAGWPQHDLTAMTGMLFGDVPAAVVWDGTALAWTVTVPPHAAGVVDIVLQMPDGDLIIVDGWHYGLPGPVTDITMSLADGVLSVDFTSPVNDGGSAIVDYIVTPEWLGGDDPASGAALVPVHGLASPVVFAVAAGANEYGCTIQAINGEGAGDVTPSRRHHLVFDPAATYNYAPIAGATQTVVAQFIAWDGRPATGMVQNCTLRNYSGGGAALASAVSAEVDGSVTGGTAGTTSSAVVFADVALADVGPCVLSVTVDDFAGWPPYEDAISGPIEVAAP